VPTVGDVDHALDELFPYAWAEPWDRNGLLVGDPASSANRVFVSLDPTRDTIDRAHAAGADVLVTHHPAYLEAPDPIAGGTGPAGIVLHAARLGIALLNAHTNLDRSPRGADALPLAAGLTPGEPLESGTQRVSLVTVYAPEHGASALVEAMTAAGAGRIGLYAGCAFIGEGRGTFVPAEGTAPAIGAVGARSDAAEARVEMVCDPAVVSRVLEAARRAHPYEEPLLVVTETRIDRGTARLGRLCTLDSPVPLAAFASTVGARLGCTPTVWGDPDSVVGMVATNSGSGGSLLADVVRAGASVFLTGEVRYHVALEAMEAGVAIIEAGHDVTEWPHVGVMADGLRSFPQLAGRVVADEPVTRWWTP
jgi:dinuclear metal center YbgI/SA1388 family protein